MLLQLVDSMSTDLSFHVTKNFGEFLTATAHTPSTVHLHTDMTHTHTHYVRLNLVNAERCTKLNEDLGWLLCIWLEMNRLLS